MRRLLNHVFVRLLLLRTFFQTLARQLYIKLNKITRRSSGPKSLLRKFAAGFDFVRDMSRYNCDLIRCCQRCVNRLVAEDVREVFVYGERDAREILCDLAFETPVKIKMIRDSFESKGPTARNSVPLEVGAASRDKIIIASLVNVEERARRLRESGVDNDRIVLLD